MSLTLRTFSTAPKLNEKRFGEGKEFTQRANLVEGSNPFGSVFEFRFDEADGHLPLATPVPLTIDSFTILQEKKKMANGGEYVRLFLGLDSRGTFLAGNNSGTPARLGVAPWDDQVETIKYESGQVIYRQRVQLHDLDTMDGFPFELTSDDPKATLLAGRTYQLTARNFAQAAYGGIRIDAKSTFVEAKRKASA